MGLFDFAKKTEPKSTLAIFDYSDEGNTKKETPRILGGNRPNPELVVIPKMDLDFPFIASGVANAFSDLNRSLTLSPHWDVCTISTIVSLLKLDLSPKQKAAKEKLSAIHCVKWSKIHPAAVAEIPELINLIINPTKPAAAVLLEKGRLDLSDF